ncbi:hypothetical protein [Candidatus Spyradosoma sp. SGI.093]|uniref:hypothetical protein n=1 Tax=Candidatus Spyradosoma sp. SGI.093 TaxID=3420583 RepID=UPI003D071F50
MKSKITELCLMSAALVACAVPALAAELPSPASGEDATALVVVCLLALIPVAAYVFIQVSAVRGFRCVRKAKVRLAIEQARIHKRIPVPATEAPEARARAEALFAEYSEKWLGGVKFDALRDGKGIASSGAATEAAFATLEAMKAVPGVGGDRVAADMLNVFGEYANRSQERENIHVSRFSASGYPALFGWPVVVGAPIFAVAMVALWIFLGVNEGLPAWAHVVFALLVVMSLANAFVCYTNVAASKIVFLAPRRLVAKSLEEPWMRWSLKALVWGSKIDRGFCSHLNEALRNNTYYQIDRQNDRILYWTDYEAAWMSATYVNAFKKGIHAQIIQIVYVFVLPWKTPKIYRRNFESED